jgi:hypothetical protein
MHGLCQDQKCFFSKQNQGFPEFPDALTTRACPVLRRNETGISDWSNGGGTTLKFKRAD